MGKRDRLRKDRVIRGEEMGQKERAVREAEDRDLTRKLDVIERLANEYGGTIVAEEIALLGKQGRLTI